MRSLHARCLICLLLFGCSMPVAANLDENDANQAVLVLEKSGVGADKERDPDQEGRWRISVPRGEASRAISVLAQESLPPRASPGVLEALGKSSVVPSRLAEHAKWTTGVAGDLERSLRSVDGVLSARVHLAVPPKEMLKTEDDLQPSASVLVRHRGATPPLAAAEVQQLVAGAVSGLLPEQVSVVLSTSSGVRASDRELLRFGPVTVTRGSLVALKWGVAAAALLNLLLISAVSWLWFRLRRRDLALLEVQNNIESPSPAR